MRTMSAAFQNAGVEPEAAALRKAISDCNQSKNPAMALWMILYKDKDLAAAAMRYLIANFNPSRLPAPIAPTISVPPTRREAVRTFASRDAAKAKSVVLAREIVTEVIRSAYDYQMGSGRSIGQYAVHELEKLRKERGAQFRIANSVLSALPANVDPFALIRDSIRETTLNEIITMETSLRPAS